MVPNPANFFGNIKTKNRSCKPFLLLTRPMQFNRCPLRPFPSWQAMQTLLLVVAVVPAVVVVVVNK
jgi:hypothetical protein